MPSPICRTVPTSARSVSTSYCSIRSRRIDVISSGRSFKSLSTPYECLSQSFQPAAHARVDSVRPRLQHDAADEVGVDTPCRFNLASRRLFDLRDDRLCFIVRQLPRGGELDGEAALFARHQPLELLRDLVQLPRAALLRDEQEKILEQRFVVARDVREDVGLRRRLELRVAQDVAQLRRLLDRHRKVRERLAHLCEPALLLRRREQRLGVDALRRCYFRSSRREKSSEPIASVMSSRSRALSSVLPTTIAVASSVRSATSERICSSARAVSEAISRRVSSRRRCRSVSVSSRIRCSIDSRVFRASARISSAWLRASFISARCSSRSRRASARALSASSI